MKPLKRIQCLVTCIFVLAALAVGVHADTPPDVDLTNRNNIMFVNDESGSMTQSDPDKLRYEAIRMFTALMAQRGNMIGSVSFHHEIISTQGMTRVNGFADKNGFMDAVSAYTPPSSNFGMTNIGLALQTAVEILDKGRDPELSTIMILLTDGKTEMPTEKETALSVEQKADAIDAAREAGYKIYTICLGGGEHESELKQIAMATGGEYACVTKAEDLKDVEMMFYRIIFDTLSDEATDSVISADGHASRSFTVPGIGVEELNVIIEGAIDGCQVAAPDGRVFQQADLDPITTKGKNFRLLKFENPADGLWNVDVTGEPGVAVTFRPLFNSSFYVDYSRTGPDGNIGDVVHFRAVICDRNGPVTDTAKYAGFLGTVHISEGGTDVPYPMPLGNGGFEFDYTVRDAGTYKCYVAVSRDDLEVRGREDSFSIKNNDPIPPEDTIQKHTFLWPFIGGTASVDLNGTVTDPDGDAIRYAVDSSAFMEEDYTLEDNVLTLRNFSIPRGTFTIVADDGRGGECTFNVKMTSTNVGILMAAALLLGGIIVVFILAYVISAAGRKAFQGDITVVLPTGYARGLSIRKHGAELPRGSVLLSDFDLETQSTLPGKVRLAVDWQKQKKCIWLKSPTPVYCSAEFGRRKKKWRLDSMMEYAFSKEPDTSMGVQIQFVHNQDMQMYDQF